KNIVKVKFDIGEVGRVDEATLAPLVLRFLLANEREHVIDLLFVKNSVRFPKQKFQFWFDLNVGRNLHPSLTTTFADSPTLRTNVSPSKDPWLKPCSSPARCAVGCKDSCNVDTPLRGRRMRCPLARPYRRKWFCLSC